MESDGKTVTFVADVLYQAQNRGTTIEHDGVVFPARDINDFLSLGDTGKGLIDDIQLVQGGLRRVQLAQESPKRTG
jgi:hypothetical protein